ncbi:YceH family protein [Paludisphaera rhizosphaerae]|uniref:YceH family protein n=1 Tax=Paludisphaera rhizosphaerae TaxID=2711216 RepID=UPI0013EB1642|nr:DUF480 domain-containing protein [Paludisphaera rhizosphaerae]
MTDNTTPPPPAASWVPLTSRERRVVGVLAEKAKTTPEYYPMTIAATVSGCNQKSNRDPVVDYDADDVEDILTALRKKGAAILVEAGGRVPRWKHTLYDWLKVSKVELSIITELLLRGPQTEGDLRARASRMDKDALAELPALQTHLEALADRNLVVYLSPRGQKRGVIVTHGLYPPDELEKVRQAYANMAPIDDEPAPRSASPRVDSSPGWRDEVAGLRAEVEELRGRIDTLTAELRELRTALGA